MADSHNFNLKKNPFQKADCSKSNPKSDQLNMWHWYYLNIKDWQVHISAETKLEQFMFYSWLNAMGRMVKRKSYEKGTTSDWKLPEKIDIIPPCAL